MEKETGMAGMWRGDSDRGKGHISFPLGRWRYRRARVGRSRIACYISPPATASGQSPLLLAGAAGARLAAGGWWRPPGWPGGHGKQARG